MRIENIEKMRTDVASTLTEVFCHADARLEKIVTPNGFTINHPVVLRKGVTWDSQMWLAVEVSSYDGSLYLWDEHDELHMIIEPRSFKNKMTMIAYLIKAIMDKAQQDMITIY